MAGLFHQYGSALCGTHACRHACEAFSHKKPGNFYAGLETNDKNDPAHPWHPNYIIQI